MPRNPKAASIKKEKLAKANELQDVFARNRKYKPEYAQSLIEHMSDGSSFYSFGARVSVGKTTLYDWLEKYPEFKEAYEIARLQSLAWWEKQGQEGLWNTKETSLNTGAFVFQVSNRFKGEGYTRNPQANEGATESRLELEVVDLDLDRMVSTDDL